MIVVVKKNADPARVKALISHLETEGTQVQVLEGDQALLLLLIGDTWAVDVDAIQSMDIVEAVKRIQEPYRLAARHNHPDDTVVDVGGVKLGGGNFQFIAGPCSVEREKQICSIAESVKAAGATILRGGAFKSRISPYNFQGLRELGIEMLLEAKRRTGMPIVTEAMDIAHLPFFDEVDMIQVGAKNMQNIELLKELGHIGKPILLKRGIACTLSELLLSAEYIMAGGNTQIVLCERGIRNFDPCTKATLDLSAVPILKELTHLPVIVDPNHAMGTAKLVLPMSLAAVAAGADGLMIEVHNDPENALCDGPQALTPAAFEKLVQNVNQIRPYAWKFQA